jgi:hypothetical protein
VLALRVLLLQVCSQGHAAGCQTSRVDHVVRRGVVLHLLQKAQQKQAQKR